MRDRTADVAEGRRDVASQLRGTWQLERLNVPIFQDDAAKTALESRQRRIWPEAFCDRALAPSHLRSRYLAVQQPQLIARDIYKSFRIGARRIEVLRGISMQVAHNETVFLSGASGAGKTTLLYTLAGLERPDSGSVELEGERLYCRGSRVEARVRNKKMGFVFQGYFLLPELTALENVILPGMIGGRSGREEAQASLVSVGLADRMHHLPAELSGGEQQRVAIARALTNNPDIIFADEPTGNLDSKTGDVIMDLLLNLARDRNKTLLVVTHDAHLATRGDRQLHIADGRLQ